MVGKKGVTIQGDSVESLSTAQDPGDDLVQLRTGPEQKPCLKGAAGDLEGRAAFRRIAKFSHAPKLKFLSFSAIFPT